ncbi:MAG: pilus assembly PilX family protein [Burkholderiaceae bacterium]
MTMRIHIGGYRRLQRGFSLISAIFLLVVLAGLGAAMLTISGAQQTGSALDIEGARAYQAARAGIEWGVHRVVNAPAACFGNASFKPQAPTLASFTITVTCGRIETSGIVVFQIQSTACNQPVGGICPGVGGNTYYVERQLQATVGG